MNYLKEIVAFNEYKLINPMSAGQISLWYALIGISNKSGWKKWFSISNRVLELSAGLSRSGVAKAREALKSIGLIDYKFNGMNATEYKLKSLVKFDDSNQESNQVGNQVGKQVGKQVGNTLYKQNKTKQNKYYNNKNAVRKSPLNNYDDANADDYVKFEEGVLDMMMSEYG